MESFDGVTDSSVQKRMAIPKLRKLIDEYTKLFDELACRVKEWAETYEFEEEFYRKIIILHYCDITRRKGELQKDISYIDDNFRADRFRIKLRAMWFKQIAEERIYFGDLTQI